MSFSPRGKSSFPNQDFSLISVLTSVYIMFIVLSFRDYFFFVPSFSGPNPVIAYAQVLVALGWVSLIILPPFALRNWSQIGRLGPIFLLTGALLWPVSTLLIKILNLAIYGNPSVGYLQKHPIFFLMEYGIPALYLYIAREKRYLL